MTLNRRDTLKLFAGAAAIAALPALPARAATGEFLSLIHI